MSNSLNDSFNGATPDELNFVPDSYCADGHPVAAMAQNIVGDARRFLVREYLHEAMHDEKRAAWVGIDPVYLADHLAPTLRDEFVARDPMANASGEYLPRYRRGEVEIARLVINTLPRIVYSVRARRSRQGGRIHYRMVDEHGTRFRLEQRTSMEYLSLGDLVRLIDTAQPDTFDPLTIPLPETLLHWRAGTWYTDLEQLMCFVRVRSEVYPWLNGFYGRRLSNWVRQHAADAHGRIVAG